MELPNLLKDAIGSIITIRDDANDNTKKIFGTGKYLLTLTEDKVLLESHSMEKNKRMLELDESDKPTGKAHFIGSTLTYKEIKERFVICT